MDLEKSAAALGRDIDAGRLDPVELAEATFEAIAAHPAGTRIYARTMRPRARAEAEAARARARDGVRRGPLDGVPVSWKDVFDTAGTETEGGSALLAGRVPARDADLVALAAMGGLVSLGKTHQTELAFSGLGINARTATPPNRHDPELAPGGSSSGAAASVAFGLAALAMGSDTGGSARVPPAWNDLVGLKPPAAALSRAGVLPLCPRFDVAGPIARTVEDAALLFAALVPEAPTDLAGADLAGRRFLALEDAALAPLDEGPEAAFEDALARLSAAGARVERGALPGVGEAMALSPVLYPTEAYATWGAEIEARGELMDPRIRARFEQGRDPAGHAYARAWATLAALRRGFAAAAAGFDAVLLPTVAILPPPVAALDADPAVFAERNLATLRNTRLANLMDLAALTVPAGRRHCGLMAMAAPGRTRLLLRLGAAVERTLGG